jgi:hypothetical protein
MRRAISFLLIMCVTTGLLAGGYGYSPTYFDRLTVGTLTVGGITSGTLAPDLFVVTDSTGLFTSYDLYDGSNVFGSRDAFTTGNNGTEITNGVTNGTTTFGAALHGKTVAAGDLLYITSSTTAADVGFYRIIASTANDFTLDRAPSGTATAVHAQVYNMALSYDIGTHSQLDSDFTSVYWGSQTFRNGGTSGAAIALMEGSGGGTNTMTFKAPDSLAGNVVVTGPSSTCTLPGLGLANTFTANQMIDGSADAIQLLVQGHSTQTSFPFVVETSSGTDLLTVSNGGSLWVKNYINLDTGIVEQATSGTTLTLNGYQGSFTGAGPGVKINTPPMSGTTASTGLNVSSTNTKSANAHSVMSITPTYNQTSTAGGTDLTINRTETAVGSGAQFLIDAQTGGASKFSVTNGGLVANRVKSITIPDSGGPGAAAYTINPEDLSVAAGAISSYIELTCSDADGCDITMGETDVVVGTILNVVNIGANVCNFADTGGVSELAGAFAAGQYDSLSLRYATGTWVETGRSNN